MNSRMMTSGQVHTASGQCISLRCPSDEWAAAQTFISTHVLSVSVPSTKQTLVSHGGYGRYTRYDIIQHKYAGGGCGYIEVLEIKDAPESRCPFVIFESDHNGTRFSEWESLELAVAAWERSWGSEDCRNDLPKQSGCKRRVDCGVLTPWFYAVGDEILQGDYALANGLQDDPVFRVGRKFVVPGPKGMMNILTCMGTRFYAGTDVNHFPYRSRPYRLVYFDDGSTICLQEENGAWIPANKYRPLPRPVHDGEEWIEDAVNRFRALLSGMNEGFNLKFHDGSTVTVKRSVKGKKPPSVAGKYELRITYDGGKVRTGSAPFVPTTQWPDIVSRVKGSPDFPNVEKVEVLGCEPTPGGQKWSGCFYVKSPKSKP